jgi:hypothetical protein
MCLSVDFTAQHLEYCVLQALLAHILHRLVGRHQSPKKFFLYSELYCSMTPCDRGIIAGFCCQ